MNLDKNFERTPTFQNKLIYVFSIDDDAHRGLLKIGDTTVDVNTPIDRLYPNSKNLNDAAKNRIKSYTGTAGIKYKLEYTELAIRQIKSEDGSVKLKSFRDSDVHKVLLNSQIKQVKVSATSGREWFKVDLETVKRAIEAVKIGNTNLIGTSSRTKTQIVFRPEQEEAINKTIKQFKSGKIMLWNAKMRFGKTLTALELIKRGRYRKNIIITHRPVVDQGWREDFDKIFDADDGYKYGSKKDVPNDSDISLLGDKFVYFASMQDLRGSSVVGGKFDKNCSIFVIEWDLVIVDEAHEGTTTALGDEVIKNILKEDTCPQTKFLALSGTPFNIISKYDEKNVYTWDYMMEQKAKENWPLQHFGDSNPYSDLPKLQIYTYDLGNLLNSPSYIELVDKAFNFTEFFKVRRKGALNEGGDVSFSDNLEFCHEEDVKSFLNLITKTDADSFYPYSNDKLRRLFKHTLWVIPGVKEAKALKELMLLHPVFGSGRFNIVNVAGNGDEEIDNALEAVKTAIAISKEDEYTITLTCGKLTTGVTVPEWTAVFMLAGSYATSASSYLQTIFRVQSPCNENGKIKTNCYVFDFAPDRTLKMVADSISLSKRAGRTSDSDRSRLGEFLNYCPVISIDGTRMKEYSTDNLLQQLKKVYVDRAVRTGFDDTSIYSDELYKLTPSDIVEFKDLKAIIGSTAANAKTGDIDINKQGFSDELHEKNDELKRKKKSELTEEEKEALKQFEEIKKNRRAAISILRGISVRMPLLIYGADIPLKEDFKIEDFLNDKIVDPASWNEFMPKGVTKELFKKFIKFYDKDIFIFAGRKIRNIVKSADELDPTERVNRIASVFSYFKNPDKETVLTPWRVVNMHLGLVLGGFNFFDEKYSDNINIPREVKTCELGKHFIKKDNLHILEINSKTGLYPLYVAYSIYRNKLCSYSASELSNELKRQIWNEVIENNIFVICKTEMAKFITKRTLAGFNNVKINAHYFENLINTLQSGKELQFIQKITSNQYWKCRSDEQMKFDAVIGNPPYQESAKDTSDAPVYHLFMEAAFKISPIVSFITPARFLFNAGKTPKKWNDKVLNDPHFKVVYLASNSTEVFPNVDIKGGVVISLRNNEKNFGAIGFYSQFPELNSILNKVLNSSDFKSIKDFIFMQNKFNLNSLYRDYPKLISEIGSNGKEKRLTTNIFNLKEIFTEFKQSESDIEIYGLINNTRVSRYISKKYIEDHVNLYEYKVIVPKSNGSGAIGEILSTPVIGRPVIGRPVIGYTQSFISIGKFNTECMANACLKYIKTKFSRCMLGTLKVTQHNNPPTWANVPIQDFSDRSDIDWSKSISEIDQQLYKKYLLSEQEKNFIEEKIQPMN